MEQERAAAAWERVRDVAKTEYKKEYGSLARSAPADIQANGLGQTLAFWHAKKDAHYKALLDHVFGWVMGRMDKPGSWPGSLLDWVVKDASTNDYRRATAEAMAFLSWLKRFAEAEL